MLFTVAFLSIIIIILLLLGLALLWNNTCILMYKLSLGSVNILKNYTPRFDSISVETLCSFVGEWCIIITTTIIIIVLIYIFVISRYFYVWQLL